MWPQCRLARPVRLVDGGSTRSAFSVPVSSGVTREMAADVVESGLDTAGDHSHAGGSRQCNQRNHQSIFDKILPALTLNQSICQVLHPYREDQYHDVHPPLRSFGDDAVPPVGFKKLEHDYRAIGDLTKRSRLELFACPGLLHLQRRLEDRQVNHSRSTAYDRGPRLLERWAVIGCLHRRFGW